MRIIIDTREQAPFAFTGSLNDLIGCLMGKDRERFERELARGGIYDLFAVVVEASPGDVSQGHYRSDMKPQAALQSIVSFQVRYRAPFLWCGTRAGAEYMTYSLLAKYLREIGERYKLAVKTQEKKERVSGESGPLAPIQGGP